MVESPRLVLYTDSLAGKREEVFSELGKQMGGPFI